MIGDTILCVLLLFVLVVLAQDLIVTRRWLARLDEQRDDMDRRWAEIRRKLDCEVGSDPPEGDLS